MPPPASVDPPSDFPPLPLAAALRAYPAQAPVRCALRIPGGDPLRPTQPHADLGSTLPPGPDIAGHVLARHAARNTLPANYFKKSGTSRSSSSPAGAGRTGGPNPDGGELGGAAAGPGGVPSWLNPPDSTGTGVGGGGGPPAVAPGAPLPGAAAAPGGRGFGG